MFEPPQGGFFMPEIWRAGPVDTVQLKALFNVDTRAGSRPWLAAAVLYRHYGLLT